MRFDPFMVFVIKIPFLWYVTPCNSSYALLRPLVLVGLFVFLLPFTRENFPVP